jgi:cytochrome c oxidase cbb3-type subunit 3
MSDGWSWYIIVLVVANILGMWWLIWWSGKGSSAKYAEGAELGHSWDNGELKEFNNPLPRWWLWLFYITIFFAFLYLALFPGLGKVTGALGWTQEGEYDEEVKAADAEYGPIFDKYLKQDLAVVAKDPAAQKMGGRIYVTYCAMCHGADAKGATGFPNLADGDWLYGGEPKTIKTTILKGREGVMPGFAAALGGDQGVDEMVEYVLKLAGKEHDAKKAAAAEPKWPICAGCHMPNGQGNQALGAPNLADNVWLYGGSRAAIRKSLVAGRNGVMPAYEKFLGEAKVHLAAAYIYGLSSVK